MRCQLVVNGAVIGFVDAEPECFETCDRCGNCLGCNRQNNCEQEDYGDNLSTLQDHVWLKEFVDEEEAFAFARQAVAEGWYHTTTDRELA